MLIFHFEHTGLIYFFQQNKFYFLVILRKHIGMSTLVQLNNNHLKVSPD